LDNWCADKSDAIVRYTLAEDNKQIFASKYMLYLPTEQELKNEIAVIGEEKEVARKALEVVKTENKIYK
jgi:hypothetical protein